MSEYTLTREGFEKAIKWSLSSPADELQAYADAIVLPTYHQTVNGQYMDYNAWFERMKEERGHSTKYEARLEDFLRDADSLAARVKGTVTVDGVKVWFESFHFAKVDKETGKLASLVEKTASGQV